MTRRERAEAGEKLACSNCGQKQPADQFNWHPSAGSPVHSWCLACRRAEQTRRNRGERAAKDRGRTQDPAKIAAQWRRHRATERGRLTCALACARQRLRHLDAAGVDAGRLDTARANVERLRALRDAAEKHPQAELLAAETASRRVADNQALAGYMANAFRRAGEAIGLEWDDLYQFGLIGLMRAATAYDPLRGTKFSTVAGAYARNEILRGLRESGGYVGRRDGKVRAWVQPTDMDTLVVEAKGDEAHPADGATADAHALLARLDQRSRTILQLRYGIGGGEPLSLEAVAKRIGVCKERVRQIERHAKNRLRTTSKEAS